MLTMGRVLSVAATDRRAIPVLPAVSVAVTVIRFVPARSAIPAADQLVVPVATPLPPRSLVHATRATPNSSDAVPPIDSVGTAVPKLAADVGVANRISGAPPSVSVTVNAARPTLRSEEHTSELQSPCS